MRVCAFAGFVGDLIQDWIQCTQRTPDHLRGTTMADKAERVQTGHVACLVCLGKQHHVSNGSVFCFVFACCHVAVCHSRAAVMAAIAAAASAARPTASLRCCPSCGVLCRTARLAAPACLQHTAHSRLQLLSSPLSAALVHQAAGQNHQLLLMISSSSNHVALSSSSNHRCPLWWWAVVARLWLCKPRGLSCAPQTRQLLSATSSSCLSSNSSHRNTWSSWVQI